MKLPKEVEVIEVIPIEEPIYIPNQEENKPEPAETPVVVPIEYLWRQ